MSDSRKNEKYIIAYGAGAALLVALVGFLYFAKPAAVPETDDPIASREVVSYGIMPASGEGEAVIKYEYRGAPLPEKLAPDELVGKRTENSYTRDLGPVDPAAPDKVRRYQSVFYSSDTYVKDGGTWYYREVATTTEAAFEQARKRNPLASLFWETAYAASIAPFSGSGDGYINESESGDAENPQTFATCLAGVGNIGPNPVNGATSMEAASQRTGAGTACYVSQAYIPFDTSAMPGSAVVSAATLSLYVVAKANGVNDGNDLIDIVQTNQASSATLAAADWNHFGFTLGATSLDITSMTTSAYNVFTLNATGLGWIKGSGQVSNCGSTAGVTCLGIVEHHQITGSIANNLQGDSITVSTNENTGTSQDPFLSVTYTASSFAFWQFQDY